ncbi:hypothetical protein EB796_002939 [Bugula neritina]|uniref:Uncharacterized protein n=1 Tax=Bugula neritina TaxID=10212 RepID=A0A7J7KKG3_BUGNE|nr:hypothetical protein EB796_002939 [Bugula neritina]
MNFLIAGTQSFLAICILAILKEDKEDKVIFFGNIEQAVNTSAKGNMCLLVGKQDGTVVVPVYDWANFLEVKKIVGINDTINSQ